MKRSDPIKNALKNIFVLFAFVILSNESLFAQTAGDFRSAGSGGWSNASTASAKAVVTGGVVTKILVTGQSSGYTTAPTVTIAGNATATATIANGKIIAINVTNGGSGYTAVPAVFISSPTGQQVSIWEKYQAAASTNWKIAFQADLGKDSVAMRIPGYNASSWVTATVPGTILTRLC
jgi:hypothetical protein